ncbi:MAG: lipoate--protein ligase family protein [Actinomycetota bacterium]|nr:lipoate--protein ligase family protein [Actinomycetota bacterium]MDQ3719288.1 lipoate--protein ligase family protein [Actinomycetota bacterium]
MSLSVIRHSLPHDPALDTAVSRALLERVAAGELPETLRLARPGPIVAFGKLDVVGSGYGEAVIVARAGGFEAVERLAGGRAAVFHEGTISFSHAIPDSDPRPGVRARFDQVAGRVARALRTLGVDARVGEVPGEYCPGSHSVSAGGRTKLMGVGQRLISGGAHVGGVIVVEGADRVRDILVPVYGAMGLDWNPDVTGAVVDEAPTATVEATIGALREAFASEYELEEAELEEETLELARRLAPEHLSPSE